MLNKTGKILSIIFTIVLSTVSALICQAIVWVFNTWKNLSLDELIFQLNAPAEGTNVDLVLDFFHTCMPGTILIFLNVAVLLIGLRKRKKSFRIAVLFCAFVSLICLGNSVFSAWTKLEVADYIENKNTVSSFIDDNYVEAKDVQITFPEEKRNLIYIYLESMETTYASYEEGGAFEEGCIPELVKIAQENEDFSGDSLELNGGYSTPGTTWTMGALFSQTSGIPLNIAIDGNSMEMQESFFPGISTIGDILEDAGYTQTFFIGSDAVFGGRKLYFSEHGNYQIKDYNYAKEVGRIPEDYYVWWGYEDKYLFEGAKEELLALSQQGQPFNFTMLTVDTHFEDGYVCSDCLTEHGENQYANVMSCSSRKVQEFITWIQQQEFYENTTIVLAGDHPTMDGDFCAEIDSEYVRKTYTAYINAAAETEVPDLRREYTTFDHYPTTLASLGVEIEGNRLGLGTNLFSSESTLIEKYGRDVVSTEVQRESELMNKLNSTLEIEEEEIPENQAENAAETVNTVTYGYDPVTGNIQITIDNIQVDANISAVNVAVWKEEDQSDICWIQAIGQSEDTYLVDINARDYNFENGDYNIHVYAVAEDGTQIFIGNTIGTVE